MNRILTAVLLLILTTGLLITGCPSPSKPESLAPAPRVGKLAPDFQLPNLEGQSISLSNFRGKPVFVNFWATWCPSCVSEMPYIQEIYEEWSHKGLVVLAINIGESSSQVEKFMQSHNLSFPVLLDIKRDVARRYNIRGIPTTFFIDKDGIIQAMKIGVFQDKEEIERSLGKIIP